MFDRYDWKNRTAATIDEQTLTAYSYYRGRNMDRVYRNGAFANWDFKDIRYVLRHRANGEFSLSMLVDGVEQTFVPGDSNEEYEYTFTAITQTLLIGAYQTSAGVKGRFWRGWIRDFKVYGRFVSDEEVEGFLHYDTDTDDASTDPGETESSSPDEG